MPSLRRFCMVTTFYPPYHFGGDAVFVERLSRALAEAGHEVDVVHSVDAFRLQRPGDRPEIRPDPPRLRRHVLDSPLPALAALASHQLGSPAFYRAQLSRVLEAGRHDVIHFHNVSLMGGPGVLALGGALKLYTVHEYWLVCPTHSLYAMDREPCVEKHCLRCTVLAYRRPPQLWRWTGALKRGLDHLDCLLFSSRFTMDRHRADGISRPMALLPNFVEPYPEGALPPGVPSRPFFLYVGRLEGPKGIEELVEWFRSYDRADLVIAGWGSLGPVLAERTRELPHVHLLGALPADALGAIYRKAVALVVPSRCYETFGQTLAECLSCGTPVVARRLAGLEESLAQSGGGFAFDTREECLEAMEKLRLDENLRRTLGERGRAAAARLWSRQGHLDGYLALVERMLAARGTA